jgi:multisubunit Na+/H+ antiporter MnhC subunit
MTAETVADKATPPRWRGLVATALLIIGGILLPVSGLAVWVRNMLLDTDRYVETVKPLADDPVIIEAGADALTNAIFNAVDVQEMIAGILPGEGTRLAAALALEVEDFVHEKAVEVLSSDAFEGIWVTANRIAHEQISQLLLHDGDSVVVDLREALQQVLDRLSQSGIPFFENIPIENFAASLNLFQSDKLNTARDLTDVLQKVADWLPIVALVCLVASVFVALDRRKAVKRVGWAIIIGSAVLLLAVAFGRSGLSNAISPGQRREVADTTVDTVTRYLRLGIRTAFVIGVIIVLIAWVLGPGNNATKVRSVLVGGPSDEETSKFRQIVRRYRNAIIGGIAFIAVAILMSFGRLRPRDVIIAAIIVLILIVVVLRIAGAAPAGELPAEEPPAEEPEQPGPQAEPVA